MGHCLAKVDALGQRRGHRHGPALVLALEVRRHRRFPEGHQRSQRHHPAARRAKLDAIEPGGILDHAVGRLQADLDRIVADVEIAEVAAVEQGLDEGRDILDRDAEVGGALAIDVDRKLRLGGVVVEPDIAEGRVVAHRRLQRVGGGGDLVIVVAGDREAQPLPAATDAEAVGRIGEDLDARNVAEPGIEIGGDFLLAALALVPRHQRDEHEAAAAEAARGGEDILHLAAVDEGLDDLLGLADLLGRIVDGGALRRAHRDRDEAAILDRRQLRRQLREGDAGGAGKQQAGDDDDDRRVEAGGQQPGIEPLRAATDRRQPDGR